MARADLHAHTTASDGLLHPRELVRLAHRLRLAAVAITDHDTVDGVKEALDEGKKLGIEVVPGVEISTLWEGREIHMLGYFINPDDPEFLHKLWELREVRAQRTEMMVRRLNELGIHITLEEVMAKKKGNQSDLNVGRPHIAEVLIDKGVVHSMDEAFDRYLGKDGLAYVTPERIPPQEAIRLIQGCGGVAVMAHPGLAQMDELISELAEAGLDGLEVNHPDHPPEDKDKYAAIAERYGLISTAGSDFHGERNGSMYHAQLGTCTTDLSIIQQLKNKTRR
jgi:predicted metal-dependent phosphoesterase TrpH